MGKIIFAISYEVDFAKREQYLQLAKYMKEHIAGVQKRRYSIYEHRNKSNKFTEVFICNSREEYDQLEDDQDEITQQFITQLEELLIDKKMKYTTLIELE